MINYIYFNVEEAYTLPVVGMGPSWPSIEYCASRDCEIHSLRDVKPRCIVSVSDYTRGQFAFAGVEPVMRLSHTSSP